MTDQVIRKGKWFPMCEVLEINMNNRSSQCCICGEFDEGRWGIPVDLCGRIVSNDYIGEWSAKPACRECFAEHEKGKHVGQYPSF